MGEIGRHRVEHELAWEYSAHELRAAYEYALGIHPRRVPESVAAGSGEGRSPAAQPPSPPARAA